MWKRPLFAPELLREIFDVFDAINTA